MDQKITFQPSESVTFHSLTEKQNADLLIKNGWDKPIIFKMKSTRPNLFKMRPVYGMVTPGEQKKVRLLFKGFGNGSKPPCNRDRFTIVLAPAPEKCTDAMRVWREGKAPQVTQMCVRKVLEIIYNIPEDKKDAKLSGESAPAPQSATAPAPTSITAPVVSAPITNPVAPASVMASVAPAPAPAAAKTPAVPAPAAVPVAAVTPKAATAATPTAKKPPVSPAPISKKKSEEDSSSDSSSSSEDDD
uniref:Major sperm protein n=1 Tax=Steinernema glaseri TaxID=37863 RepID=A0A1I7ZSD4_9BILA